MFRPSRARNRRIAFVYSVTGCAVIAYSAFHLSAAGASARPFEMVWSSFALLSVGANLWFALGVDRTAKPQSLTLPAPRKVVVQSPPVTHGPRRRVRSR